MTRKLILFLAVTVVMLAAMPASAYVFWADCRGGVRWNNNDVTFRPSLVSYPAGSSWYQSIDASRVAWNSYTPGGNYRINYVWDTSTTQALNDGRNSITTPATWTLDPNWLAATIPRRSKCYVWPGPDANWVEMDIVFNRNHPWENSVQNQVPSYYVYNSTLVAVHEHGHALGLDHENDQPATMNGNYPNGGPIGNPGYIHPHADDARGDRALYGTSATQRDVASFAFRMLVPFDPEYPGASEPIPSPGYASRNTTIPVQFAVENRGTTSQSSVPVYFYLTSSRNSVTTSSTFLGSTTLNLNSGASVTPTVWLTIPSWAPAGYQYIGWIIDPTNAIVESDEQNNGVTHTQPVYISNNSAPVACATTSATSGSIALNVSFDASCSYDPDGNPISYLWDFGDGTTDSSPVTDHWFEPGFYDVTLTVTDSFGVSSYYYTSVYVSNCSGIYCLEEPM